MKIRVIGKRLSEIIMRLCRSLMLRSLFVLFIPLVRPSGMIFASEQQCADFIRRSGVHLLCGGKPFYAIGVNSYFLQNIAAYGDTTHVIEVFREATDLGMTTLRTWGFSDCSDSATVNGIQWAPGRFNERGLRALDYVVSKARQFSIRLIITLVNNWEDYGGMNQYIRWYAHLHPPEVTMGKAIAQRLVTGEEGRFYRYSIAGSLTHDDFYTNPSIRQWYRDYVSMIVYRVNALTGTPYGEEPSILAWELANEPRSSDPSGDIVAGWVDEMSSYLKSIDDAHLVSAGEEGLDCSPDLYRPDDLYNGQTWLFDGTGGSSYSRITALPNIDIASIHLYPEGWHLSINQALTWLNDHQRIADARQKPLILGEVGIRRWRNQFYPIIFNEAYYQNTAGTLLWQFVYDGRPDNQRFAFSCPNDTGPCGTIRDYAAKFRANRTGSPVLPSDTRLLANYPNPFNQLTIIPYNLSEQSFVRIEVFSAIGQLITLLFEGEELPGRHLTLFDGTRLASGMYVVRLSANGVVGSHKICLMK